VEEALLNYSIPKWENRNRKFNFVWVVPLKVKSHKTTQSVFNVG